jgi:hypothetical protein
MDLYAILRPVSSRYSGAPLTGPLQPAMRTTPTAVASLMTSRLVSVDP